MDVTVSLMNLFFSNKELFNKFYKSISKKNRNKVKCYIIISPLKAKKLEQKNEIVVRGFLDLPPIWCKK
jgi:ribosomal protein S17E